MGLIALHPYIRKAFAKHVKEFKRKSPPLVKPGAAMFGLLVVTNIIARHQDMREAGGKSVI